MEPHDKNLQRDSRFIIDHEYPIYTFANAICETLPGKPGFLSSGNAIQKMDVFPPAE